MGFVVFGRTLAVGQQKTTPSEIGHSALQAGHWTTQGQQGAFGGGSSIQGCSKIFKLCFGAIFTGKTALRRSIAGDAEVTTPRGAEDGCRARRPASSAGTAIAECQVDRRSSNSSRLKAGREVQQAQQTQTRSGHYLALCEDGVFVFCLVTK